MNDQRKTRAQLIEELTALRRTVQAFETPADDEIRADDDARGLKAGDAGPEQVQPGGVDMARVVDESPDGIGVVVDGRFVYCNGTLAGMFKASRDAIVGMKATALVHPDDREMVTAQIGGAPTGATSHSSSYRLLRSDGTDFLVEGLAAKTVFEDREALLINIRDITGRGEVEEKLRKSEARYRAIVEDQTELICRHVPGGTLTFVNDAYCRYFDKTKEQLLGREYFHLVPEEDWPRLERYFAQLNAEHPTASHECRVIAPNGEIRWQRWTNRAILDEQGRIIEYQCAGRDITDRKATEDALRASETRLNHLLTVGPAVLYACRLPDTRAPSYVSGSIERQLGYSPAEFLGRPDFWSEHIHPDDRTRVMDGLTAVRQHNHYVHEYRFRHKDGGYRWLRDELRLVSDAEGSASEIIGCWVDISERKQIEEKLSRNYELLQGLARIQSEIINNDDPFKFYDSLLHALLVLTRSEYGFIGKVLHGKTGVPYLETYAVSVVSEHKAVEQYIVDNFHFGMQFTELDNLFGAVITTGKPVIANDPANDPRSKGTPKGHPPLRAFLGLPLHSGAQLIGMAGLANRPGGYDAVSVQELRPLLSTCAHAMVAYATEQKRQRTESALSETVTQLRYVQHIARLGFWEWDLAGDSLFWSDEVYEIFGLEPGKFVPTYESFLALVHPADRDCVQQCVEAALHEHAPYDYDHRIVLPEGEVRYVHEDAEVIWADTGEAMRMIGTVIDITERKKTETVIRESRERLRNLTERLHAAREEERAAIARDIHDELGQTLTGLKMDLCWFADQLPKSWKRLPERVYSMISLVDSTIDFVRKLSTKLRPAILDLLGLEAALEWQLEEFAGRAGYRFTVDFPKRQLPRDRDRDMAIFRIFQEALTNIARHAQASLVEVTLQHDAGQLELTLRDDGIGIKDEDLKGVGSLGLTGMHERAGALGGKIRIENAEGGGTLVTLTVPLTRKNT